MNPSSRLFLQKLSETDLQLHQVCFPLHQFLPEFRGYPLPVWEGISLALDGAQDERVGLGRIVTARTFQQFLKGRKEWILTLISTAYFKGVFQVQKDRPLHQFLSEFSGYSLPVWEGTSLALEGAQGESIGLGRIVTAGTFQQFLKRK